MNLYETLGLMRGATPDSIKAAYRSRAKECHPDVGGNPADFGAITLAHEVLSNPERRAAYDRDGTINGGSQIDPVSTAAMNLIEQLLAEALGFSVITVDVVAQWRRVIDDRIRQMNEAKAKFESDIVRIGNVAKRFHVADGKQNLLSSMIDYKIRGIETAGANIDRDLAIHRRALEILRDYSFDPEKAPLIPVAQGFINPHSFFSFQQG
jgi:curved DNA-binding protein CbpA